MRLLAVSAAASGLSVVVACGIPSDGANVAARLPPAPTAVQCSDAPLLRQRALDERRRRDVTRSDQERIVAGGRATFHASLAIIADLKCKGTLAGVDDALKPALDAAGKAEATHSFYERAVHLADANFIATQVVAMLMKPQG